MNNYVVSARKYRPRTFDEVVGQKHVSDTLKKALQSDHLAHAYLFCGPRGVGKTTCARILAKVANCENVIDGHTACGECASCKSFEENSSFNILELDAASNNSVENIRSLIDQVRVRPNQGSYKVFIIDEVHMLSTAAFNAFLKTLEEPPPYVIFIMATTEKHKILPTILSRCQIYDFKRIQASDIVPQLQFICKAEGKTADKEALHIIGQKADGAMRDALSIFDRISSSAGDHISYDDVVSNLNILDYDYFFNMTEAIMLGKIDEILIQLDEIIHNGFEMDLFIQGLTEHFRQLLVLKFPKTEKLLDIGEKLQARYKKQSEIVNHASLMSFLHIANECDVQFPMAQNKRLHVEIALCKMAYASSLSSSKNVVEKKNTNSNEQESVKEKPSSPDTKTSEKKEEKSEVQSKKEPSPKVESSPIEKPKEKVEEKPKQVLDESPKKETKEKEEPVKSHTELLDDPLKINNLGTNSFNAANELQKKVEELKRKEQEDAANEIPVTREAVRNLISEYIETIESKSLIEIMKIVEIEIKDNAIEFHTPSIIARESVQQQDQLLDNIRDYFSKPTISIPVLKSPKRFPDYEAPKVKKPLSDQEKYKIMVKKNPNVKTLQQKLDLNP